MAAKSTVQADDPRLTARDDCGDFDSSVARVLVDAAKTVKEGAALLADTTPRYWIEEQGTGLPSWAADNDRLIETTRDADNLLDLHPALTQLRSDFNIQRLLVEGGARLHGYLLAAGLADAIVRYEAPLLLGGGLGAVSGTGVAHPQEGWRLEFEERKQLGDDLRRAFLIRNR